MGEAERRLSRCKKAPEISGAFCFAQLSPHRRPGEGRDPYSQGEVWRKPVGLASSTTDGPRGMGPSLHKDDTEGVAPAPVSRRANQQQLAIPAPARAACPASAELLPRALPAPLSAQRLAARLRWAWPARPRFAQVEAAVR